MTAQNSSILQSAKTVKRLPARNPINWLLGSQGSLARRAKTGRLPGENGPVIVDFCRVFLVCGVV
jgi:hypothetical protein